MPKVGNNAMKLAARRVQSTLQWPYTKALRAVQEAKTGPEIHWGHAAEAVIAQHAGEGFPQEEETDGEPLMKPLTGYDLMMAQKYGQDPEAAE